MRHQYLLEAGSTIYLFVQLLIALCMLSHVTLFATLWTVACQAPLSMRFPRQEHWNGFHFLLQGIFLIQRSNLCLLDWQADSLPLSHCGSPIALLTHGYFIL